MGKTTFMMAEPPRARIAAALRQATLRLADELAMPAGTAPVSAPAWNDFEWRMAMAAAAIHGIGALLARRLRWRGPALWQGFVAGQLQHGIQRQQQVESLLARIARAAADAGLGLVGLKGSALLALELHGQGERPMADIDLLARPQDLPAAAQLLRCLGYVAELATPRHQAFLPARMPEHSGFGEHAGNPLKIELHSHVAEPLPRREWDISAQLFPALLRPGLNPYPSHAALMRHLLLHAAGNLRTRSLRYIQLRDIALLAPLLPPQSWQDLAADGCWWALPPLLLVERYFPGTAPAEVLARLAAACPRLLRRAAPRWDLAQVSLSHLEIEAFPGLVWAGTPSEALCFMAGRLLPDRQTRQALRHHQATLPTLAGTHWHGQAHLLKALRWLLRAPPRMQTMYSVRRALAYVEP